MKNIIFKVIGLFVTIFAVSQVGHAEKANATVLEAKTQKKFLETSSHGCGCGCGSCIPPVETSTIDPTA